MAEERRKSTNQKEYIHLSRKASSVKSATEQIFFCILFSNFQKRSFEWAAMKATFDERFLIGSYSSKVIASTVMLNASCCLLTFFLFFLLWCAGASRILWEKKCFFCTYIVCSFVGSFDCLIYVTPSQSWAMAKCSLRLKTTQVAGELFLFSRQLTECFEATKCLKFVGLGSLSVLEVCRSWKFVGLGSPRKQNWELLFGVSFNAKTL